MRFFYFLPLIALGSHAFPRTDPEFLRSLKAKAEARGIARMPEVPVIPTKTRRQLTAEEFSASEGNCGLIDCVVFDPEAQLVSTTGEHAYQSPAADQIRGPCPGLNAASNYGYLPRSGIATLETTITGLGELYGMSVGLAAFLAVYAIIIDGDLSTMTWSIGGPQPEGLVNELLDGPGQGMSYSHNKYEGDSSIGRNDAYLNNGDAHSLNVTRFAKAYASGMDDDRYTMDKFRHVVIDNQLESIANNPLYFAPLFSTTLVSPAAYNFVINFMSNHSAEEPNGYLDGEMFKTFFGVTGDYPNFTWLPGQEQIPKNWYRRPLSRPYDLLDVPGDLLVGWAAYPNSFRLGGNVNGVNSYVGVNLTDLTAGTYDLDTLFEGDNFACFLFQTQQQAVPDFAKGLVGDLSIVTDLINNVTSGVLGSLTCPELAGYDASVFNAYPGRLYSPTGPATNYKV